MKILNELHPNTFGNSKAAINLIDMLIKHNDQRLASRVSSVINGFFVLVNQAKNIDDRVRGAYLMLLRSSMKNEISLQNCPEIIRTHTYNVMIGRCKEAIRRNNERHLEKKASEYRMRARIKNGN